MKKKSSGNSYAAIFITLAVVIFLGAIYLFVYLPRNEKEVQEQRFRALQNIDRNISGKIENSHFLLNNQLFEPEKYRTKIEHFSKEKFTLNAPEAVSSADAALQGETRRDSSYTIELDSVHQRISLDLYKHVSPFNSDDTVKKAYKIGMEFSINQFVSDLLPQGIFDHYMVLNDGQVMYEDFESGMSFFKDSLLDKRKGIVVSGVENIIISGQDYKLFFHPIRLSAKQDMVICGLLSGKRYQYEKTQLPASLVLMLVTAALVIIVIFPWIKLYHMGNKDRLKTADGVSSIMVAMLLMSLMFFLFVRYNHVFRNDKDRPDSKKVLAAQITHAFKTEINSVYRSLHSLDVFVSTHPECFIKIENLKDTAYQPKGISKADIQFIHQCLKPISASQILWLDSSGKEQRNWKTDNENAPYANYSQRQYFLDLQNQKYLKRNSGLFTLEQIISWVSGNFRSILAIPSQKSGMFAAAISFNMRSVKRPVLPAGFEFAITDNLGKVLYHSDESRNLNENLVDEFSDPANLKSCLDARTVGEFKTKYYSRQYQVRVEPMAELPYYIVILGNQKYKAVADIEIFSFTFSMLWLLFLFFMLELFVIFFASARRSFFKKQLFDTAWIGPKANSHEQYVVATLFNIVVIGLSIVLLNKIAFLLYFFMLLFSVTFISIFLTHLYERRYRETHEKDCRKNKAFTLLWLYVLVLIINCSALRILSLESFFMVMAYEFVVAIIALAIYRAGENIVKGLAKNVSPSLGLNLNYPISFSIMAFTRLVITSGIPIVFFYVSAYNFEQSIAIRHRQLQYANHLPHSLTTKKLDSLQQKNMIGSNYYYYDSAIIKTLVIDNAGKEKVDSIIHSAETNENVATAKILGLFRVTLDSLAVSEQKFYATSASDKAFYFNSMLGQHCSQSDNTITNVRTEPAGYVRLRASESDYRFPKIWDRNGSVFWIILVAGLALFFFIIRNVIRKLFCIGLPDLSSWNFLDNQILETPGLNNLVFVIGLPGSGKLGRMKEMIKNEKLFRTKKIINNGQEKEIKVPLIYNKDEPSLNNVFVVDLINIPDIGAEGKRNEEFKTYTKKMLDANPQLIIINHFEYNIQDEVTNRIKLNFIEKILLENKAMVIILSTVHPVAFLDSAIDYDSEKKSATGQDLERWHVLLGHFRIVVFPIEQCDNKSEDERLQSYFKETGSTHFLSKMQACATKTVTQWPPKMTTRKTDELAFKLQVTAHYFYMYMWQSLTKEEKFLLYDLAEDNLVNSYDNYNLNMLIAKGIIVRTDGSLMLFNKGFRNFILTAIGNAEAMKIKTQIKDSGNWSKLKNPLLIIAIAIMVFLLTSQQEAFSRLITYVAALAAAIPTLLRLFSLFDNRVAPKKE